MPGVDLTTCPLTISPGEYPVLFGALGLDGACFLEMLSAGSGRLVTCTGACCTGAATVALGCERIALDGTAMSSARICACSAATAPDIKGSVPIPRSSGACIVALGAVMPLVCAC